MAEKPPTEESSGNGTTGRKRKLLLAAGAALVLMLIAGTAALMFGNAKEADDVAQQDALPAPATYVSLGEKFVVMVQDNGRQRYLQATVSALTHDEAVVAALRLHAPLVRGRLVSLLGEQDFAQLRTDAGRQQLRERILVTLQDVLNKEMGRPGVEQVFFTDLVLQ